MDEQNQNGMEDNTSMGDDSTHVHVEGGEGGGRSPIATIVIVLLVALLGYGVYAYLTRDDGSVDEPMTEEEMMDMEEMNEEEILGDLELELQAEEEATGEPVTE